MDRITFFFFGDFRLGNNPRNLKKNEVEKLLIHESLVLPNEIFGADFPALSGIGSGSKGRKLGLENVEQFLNILWVRLR